VLTLGIQVGLEGSKAPHSHPGAIAAPTWRNADVDVMVESERDGLTRCGFRAWVKVPAHRASEIGRVPPELNLLSMMERGM
jgi:hypothetical protein